MKGMCCALYPMRSARIQQKSGAGNLTARARFAKSSIAVQRLRSAALLVVFDLVEERITQGVGIGIPLAGPLVGRQRRRPDRIGTVVAMHRKIETVAEEQLRPFPPGAELLDPAQQIVTVDQGRRHI